MSYRIELDPGVEQDLAELASAQAGIRRFRLSAAEVGQTIDRAITLMDALRSDPRRGELLSGRPNAMILRGVRRQKSDPRDPPPKDRHGRPQPRMRLVWVNEPDEASVETAYFLTVTHRGTQPYNRAPARLGARRARRHRP